MPTTILSSKGQVIIPKPVREARHWKTGQRLEIIESGESIILKPANPFPARTIKEVSGCLNYQGKAKTLGEMEEAIAKGVKETFRDSD